MNLKSFVLLICLSLGSCNLIDYHPYDGRLNDTETNINKKNLEKIYAACEGKDTIRFICLSDTQRFFDETKSFVKHANQLDSVDFVIHAGDLIEFGTKKEFEWMHDILSKLRYPYIALIGNHDIVGYGDNVFKKMYGDTNFSFILNDTKFLCLNTNALEYNYLSDIPDFSFIKQELRDSLSHRQTIALMHAPPFSEQFEEKTNNVFHAHLKQFPSLLFCLHGHRHHFSETDLFKDGVWYYGCGSIEKRTYLLFTITKGSYSYERISF